MKNHYTYSLNTILNTNQIQPHLYQQILHDIKSPLQQASIDLTNDNSIDIERIPKRPNIPPAPPRSPLNAQADINFSRTHESYELSMRESPDKMKVQFHDEVIESVLSPLDQQISFKEEHKQPFFNCGGFMESILRDENSFEIQLPPRTRQTKYYKRRPIFEGSRLSRTTKTYKPIQEAIRILQEVGETQMAMFFQLLRELQRELMNVTQQKEEIKGYLEIIYERLSNNIEYLQEEEQKSPETHRILRRLRSKNTYEMITKMVKTSSPSRNSQAEKKLQKLMTSLGNLEIIIANFMQRKEAINVLELVYGYLTQNFSNQRTLLQQISCLCDSFSCKVNLNSFQLIWREGDQRKLSRDEFIEGISMNDCVVRLPKSFQQDLSRKGFKRNQ